MLSKIWAVVEIIQALWSLIKSFMAYQDQKKAEELERQRLAREQAIQDAQNAKTEEDAFDAQERIVSNPP